MLRLQPQYMYLLIEIRLNILLKCHGSYIRVNNADFKKLKDLGFLI